MTVLSGRARFGARSVLRAVFFGATALFALFSSGCGNNNFTYGTPVITFSTTPGPFTAYVVEIDQIVLTRNDNTPVYPLLQPQIVDFTKFNDMPEVFGAPAILEGTYTSASITVNYGASLYQNAAQIFLNSNGQSVAVSPVDSTGAAAGSVTYTVTFDPAHPLVITRGVSVPIDFNFDLSVANVFNGSQVEVHPFISASTVPTYTKPMRARGVYVTTDTVNNNNFTMNARSFFDTQGSPSGAIEVLTDSNTAYNINGVSYQGAAGLAAIKGLQINTIIEAYGTFADLNNITPSFTATQVYAGVAVENLLTDRITGTVSSLSGDTLNIHGAEIETRCVSIPIGVAVTFQDDFAVTVSNTTLVTVDGHPELGTVPISEISVGQQVDIEAVATTVNCGTATSPADGTQGLVRIVPTTGWGALNGTTASGIAANLFTLGGYQPEALTFTGTGSATGADADPTAYGINTTGLDTSAITANAPLFRFDGLVAPYGGATAAADFTASSVTAAAATDQILIVEWNASTATPFQTKDANGLVVDITDSIANGILGATHIIQTGPMTIENPLTTIDLTSPVVNPIIVADTTQTDQFAIGNPTSTTGLAIFHEYSSFLTQLNTVLNQVNTIHKLVAVGRYDQATNTFTAYRIDMVQLP